MRPSRSLRFDIASAPAWAQSPSPSAVISTVPDDPILFTFKVGPPVLGMLVAMPIFSQLRRRIYVLRRGLRVGLMHDLG